MQQPAFQQRLVDVVVEVAQDSRVEAVGYRGNVRWVAFRWEPCGDEPFYDDGRTSGTGALADRRSGA